MILPAHPSSPIATTSSSSRTARRGARPRPSARRSTSIRASRCWLRSPSTSKLCAGRDHLICYAMKANSNLAVLDTFARPDAASTSSPAESLARVLAAGARPPRRLFRCRQDPRGDAPGAGGRRDVLQRRKRRRAARPLARLPRTTGQTARVSLRVNPDVDARTHPYISTGLKRQQVRYRARPAPWPLSTRSRAAGPPDGRHRLPHRFADHRDRSLPRCPGPASRSRRGGRSRRHGDSAHRSGWRPGNCVCRRASAGGRRARSRLLERSTRADTAIARCSWNRVARWSAMRARCSARCSTSSRAKRRTSASSTRP